MAQACRSLGGLATGWRPGTAVPLRIPIPVRARVPVGLASSERRCGGGRYVPCRSTGHAGALEDRREGPLGRLPWKTIAAVATGCALWYLAAACVRHSGPFLSTTAAAIASHGAFAHIQAHAHAHAHSHAHVHLSAGAKSIWAGLLAGCLHTLAGPDHLAALTPLTVGRSRFKAAFLGALWGGGHCAGQFLLGLVFVLMKDRFDGLVPFLRNFGGPLVGVTLLAIGLSGLYETFFDKGHHHHHGHQHGAEAHSHPGEPLSIVPNPDGTASVVPEKKSFRLVTFATGLVYGLQPDALFVIIPALALPTKAAAVLYVFMYVLGTVGAMWGFTFAIGATSEALRKHSESSVKHLSTASSLVAITVGVLVILSGMGIVDVPYLDCCH